jgi:hypothetical protein
MTSHFTIDVEKMNEVLVNNTTASVPAELAKDNFVIEISEHLGLKALNEFLSDDSKALTSNESKQKILSDLLKSISKIESINNIDYDLSYPISDRTRTFLTKSASMDYKKRQLSSIVAKCALVIADNKKKEEIKSTFEKSYSEFIEGYKDELYRDIPRNYSSIKIIKNGKLLDSALGSERYVELDPKNASEEIRKNFEKVNKDLSLGLSKAQIDATLFSLDQGAFGGSVAHYAPLALDHKYMPISQSTNSRGDSKPVFDFKLNIEGDNVTLECVKYASIRDSENPDKEVGYLLMHSSLDITNLKSEEFKIGLSDPVTATLSAYSSVDIDFAIPDEILSKSKKTAEDKFIDFYLTTKDLSSPEKINQFLLSAPSNMVEKFAFGVAKDMHKSPNGELDLEKSAKLFTDFFENMDFSRAKRYVQKMADKKDIKTNITTFERVGNFFQDIGDWISGISKPEDILFDSKDAAIKPKKIKSHIVETKITEPEPSLLSTQEELTEVSSQKNEVELVNPLHVLEGSRKATFPPEVIKTVYEIKKKNPLLETKENKPSKDFRKRESKKKETREKGL